MAAHGAARATWRSDVPPAGRVAFPVAAGAAVPIGDAALTRDALASQGTAITLSDACQAADPRTADAELSARCADARGRHVRHLDEMLRTCRYAAEPTWEAYRRSLRDSVVR